MKTLHLTPSLFPRRFLGAALIFALFSGMECEKDPNAPDTLPAITQEGRNTFGCLIDGKVFIPKGSGTNLVKVVTKSGDAFFIKMIHNSLGSIIIDLESNSGGTKVNCIRYSNYGSNCIYEICPPGNHTLTITRLDLNQKIISGTFSFNLPSKTNCNAVSITEGRFDLIYR